MEDLQQPLLPQPPIFEEDHKITPNGIHVTTTDRALRLDILDEGGEEDREENDCSESPDNGKAQQIYSALGQRPSLGSISPIDPFRNHTETIDGVYEFIKIIICLPLAVVRMTLAILLTLSGFLLTKLALLGWKQTHAAMPKWRYNLMYGTRLCARFILFCFGYHWIRRIGNPAKREVAPIIVSNHVCYTDPIFYFYELFPSIVSSKSHDDIPILGTVIRAMQVIYVDRLSPVSRKNAGIEIKRKALCNDFPRVMLFPEGTTTNGRSLIYFQLGAFTPGLPVQPVVIRYPFIHFDTSWGKISAVKLIFRMLTQFHNFMEIEYLPVVYPSQKDRRDAPTFARKVRHVIARSLNVPETDHSYGDLILAMKASEFKLMPAASYMVEMAKMEKLFHISTMEAKECLEKFAAMAAIHGGFLTKDQFLEALGLPNTSFSEQIFDFFDQQGEGFIGFREFLASEAFLAKHQDFEKLCKIGFEACDFRNQGFLSFIEVERRLRIIFPLITELQVQGLFKKLDMDSDDCVSWDDFRSFLEAYPHFLLVFLS